MAEEIITETNRETATDHAYGGAQIPILGFSSKIFCMAVHISAIMLS